MKKEVLWEMNLDKTQISGQSRIEGREKHVWKHGMTLLYYVEVGTEQWGSYWESSNVARQWGADCFHSVLNLIRNQ